MIAVERLTKRYGERTAIDAVSFEVSKGEILGFLGPNGAGKTTTMRILSGFMPASSGRALLAGYDVAEHPLEVKRRIGYLPEHPPLYSEMTVGDYLDFVARLKGILPWKRSEAIARVVDRCGLGDVRGRLLKNLSKGYQQRVGLAQAMVHDPEILILDEPTIGLDPKQIADIRSLIKELGGDHTVILSTHILPEVTMTCRRVVIINEGRVVAQDTYDQLSSRLRKSEKTVVRIREEVTKGVLEKLEGVKGVVAVTEVPEDEGSLLVESARGADLREELAKLVVKQGWGLLELRPMAMTLEDIFLKLVTEEPQGSA